MSCDDVLDWVGEEVVKEYKGFQHKRWLQGAERAVHYVGARLDGEAAMDPAKSESGKALNHDDDEDELAETTVIPFVANSLHTGGNRGR